MLDVAVACELPPIAHRMFGEEFREPIMHGELAPELPCVILRIPGRVRENLRRLEPDVAATQHDDESETQLEAVLREPFENGRVGRRRARARTVASAESCGQARARDNIA